VKQRHVLALVFAAAAALVGYNMFFSLTPATHTDHDHGLANLDAGGFLRFERDGGGKRNFVGRPGKVLVMHFFTPGSAEAAAEIPELLRYRESVRDDDGVEVVLVAVRSTWPATRAAASALGAPQGAVYLDPDGRTSDLFGVRRIPETMIYDPAGRLAHQARGPADWASPQLRAEVQRFKRGVDEIH
jgi:hypothetical protein